MTLSHVRPNLVVSNIEKSLEFYRDSLDFNVIASMGKPPNFAILEKDKVSLAIIEHAVVYDVGGAGANMYIDVTDVEELYASCKAASIPMSYDLTTHPWGMKDFVVIDPDGHQIAFGQRQ